MIGMPTKIDTSDKEEQAEDIAQNALRGAHGLGLRGQGKAPVMPNRAQGLGGKGSTTKSFNDFNEAQRKVAAQFGRDTVEALSDTYDEAAAGMGAGADASLAAGSAEASPDAGSASASLDLKSLKEQLKAIKESDEAKDKVKKEADSMIAQIEELEAAVKKAQEFAAENAPVPQDAGAEGGEGA